VNQRLKIALAVTVLLVAVAALLDNRAPADSEVVASVDRANGSAEKTPPVMADSSGAVPLAGLAARPVIVTSNADPFGLYKPPEPPPKPMPVATVVAPPPMPPPPPQVPPFGYQMFGRMTGPDGKSVVYLNQEERLIGISSGAILENGFQVENITEGEVTIRHQPSGQQVRIAIPGSTL
jgi:hypothetical protein